MRYQDVARPHQCCVFCVFHRKERSSCIFTFHKAGDFDSDSNWFSVPTTMKREEMPSCFSFHSFGESRRLPKESEDDALLAKELNSLSMHERERLYEEVGVIIMMMVDDAKLFLAHACEKNTFSFLIPLGSWSQ